MSFRNPHRSLFEWYDKYVGEAESRREVYGYWVFIVGYALGIAGVLVYLATPSSVETAWFYQVREVAIVLAAFGLLLALLGIVLQLPLSRVGVYAAASGVGFALVGIGEFVQIYPQDWLRTGAGGANRTVIVLYLVGIGIVAGVAALVPVLTGERSFLLERGFPGESDRDIPLGEVRHGGLFAVYRRNPAEWTWRLVEQEAVADGVRQFASRPDVETSIDDVKSKVHEAGLLEIRHAAFRLYEDGGAWRWLLMEDDGTVAASSPGSFPDRDAVEESVSAAKEYGPDAGLIDIDGAAFDVSRAGTAWEWTLLDERRAALARCPDPVRERSTAVDSVETFRSLAGEAGLLAIDRLGVEVLTDGAASWRLVDPADVELAASVDDFEDGAAVREAIERVREGVAGAPILAADAPTFEVVADDGGTATTGSAADAAGTADDAVGAADGAADSATDPVGWRLVDGSDAVVARNHRPSADAAEAARRIDLLCENAAEATVVDREEVAFEVYRTDDRWRWRLVTGDREVAAESTTTFAAREEAEAAVAHVVAQTDIAELVEFETAAFQLYQAGGEEWRWRLIDEGGSVMADSGEDYASRDAAASSMTVLKENAPDADLLEVESAAFELHTNQADEWAWRLVDESGATIARAASTYDSKAAAKAATEATREAVGDAAVQAVDGGAFQLFERTDGEDAGWYWRFLHAAGEVVADGVAAHTTRDGVLRAVESVRTLAPAATAHRVDSAAFELRVGLDGPDWRLVDADRRPLVESSVEYATREDARRVVETVRDHLADAGVFEVGDAAFRITDAADSPAAPLAGGGAPGASADTVGDADAGAADGRYRWELVDRDRTVLARSPERYSSRDDAEAAVAAVRGLAPDAGVLEYEHAAFELVEGEEGWCWRLVDEDGAALAVSVAAFETRADAEAAHESVRESVTEASILEIETAAFELHEGEEGWRWRLVDEGGDTVAESTTVYGTRTDAREGTQSLKRYAPDAGVVVAG
ncbi:MAG: DUF1508 domain-containing protein [Salinigranum sp.]